MMWEAQIEINKLEKERQALKDYILVKLNGDEDWHAISDAANDLREIDIKISIFKQFHEIFR